MKTVSRSLMGLMVAIAATLPAWAQEARPLPPKSIPACTAAAQCGSCGPTGLHWTLGCFPRYGSPDDYCPNPYPRQCWLPYSTLLRVRPGRRLLPSVWLRSTERRSLVVVLPHASRAA
jgi:hypothetical protein